MMKIVFNIDAPSPDPPSDPRITLVKQQYPDLPDDVIDINGPIVAAGGNLQMGEGDTVKIELYEGGEPVAQLDEANESIANIVSIPTAISFSIASNGSTVPDGAWWGKDVLLTVTAGGKVATRWVRFQEH